MFRKITEKMPNSSWVCFAKLSRFLTLGFLGCVLHDLPLDAKAAPAALTLGGTNYSVLIGDVNGDGHEDILMRANPKIVPVPLDEDAFFPLVIPAQVPSFALLSDSYWGYVLVPNPDAQLRQLNWSTGNYALQFGASGPHADTVKITGAAGEFVVALGDATRQLTLVQLPGVSKAPGSVTYVHTDGLGSPVAKTDAAGNVVGRTLYEPYGYVAAGATPAVGFTGHVNDPETGLTYMQQRYYDPLAGRFLSTDPILTDAKTGASFNRYTYANNNPNQYVDPDGRDAVITRLRNGNFRVVIPIIFSGPGATAKNIGAVKTDISRTWSGKYMIDGTRRTVSVTVADKKVDGILNNITLTTGPTSLTSAQGASFVSNGTSGEWNVNSAGMKDHEAAHEAGHLMRAADHYFESIDANGNRVTVPEQKFQGNLMGELGGKPDGQNWAEIMSNKFNKIKEQEKN